MDIVIESTGNIEAFENVDEEILAPEIVPQQEEKLYSDIPEEVQEEEASEEEVVKEENEEDPEEEEAPEEEKEVIEDEENNTLLHDSNAIYVYDGFAPAESISYNGIIDTPLNEYTIQESLSLYIFLALCVGGFIVFLRGAILRWS